jgi:hypothetical protein
MVTVIGATLKKVSYGSRGMTLFHSSWFHVEQANKNRPLAPKNPRIFLNPTLQ